MRRLLPLLARLVALFLYRRLEVAGRQHVPAGRPVLIVANHAGGFLDPLLLAAALPRAPRFLAKATLARIPGVGPLLRVLGVIFVHRRVDGPAGTANEGAFAAAHAALVSRDLVAIFPEGTTHDRPHLEPLRTGAARIALGARAAGATDLVVVPAGLTFTDKVSLRASALVQFGSPLALDDLAAADVGVDDVEAVRALTARFEQALEAVAPDFPDVETWLAFDQAAEIATRSRRRLEPPLAERAALARRLGTVPEAAQRAVRDSVGRYATVLAGLRIDDRDVVAPVDTAGVARRAVYTGVLIAVLGSLVTATAVVNAIPALLVAAVSLLVTRPVSKGTVRVLVGLVAFPASWGTAAALAVDGAAAIAWLVVVFITGAVASLVLLDRAGSLVGALLRWRLTRERIATLGDAAVLRQQVVDAVYAAEGMS
ncbi:1-acyl-sn-glycerol-3-phosphate acyltransferase [Euzebya sp.]|uniref:1-acyl-sn-glycerol-3-phosphate acyltransferase n=1 Tax=Euzebya sp. TaxID=1971409 RepID=UPI003519D6A5